MRETSMKPYSIPLSCRISVFVLLIGIMFMKLVPFSAATVTSSKVWQLGKRGRCALHCLL